MSDRLSTLYQDVVAGSYDCVDRIRINGYFGLGHSAGGFRLWWRQLTGSDQTLDQTHLMRLAGRFAEGDLSERARRYVREIATDVDLRLCAPKRGFQAMSRSPAPSAH